MESELAGITPFEVIPIGSVEDCRGILSISQFYDKLGLLARLESGEIPKVNQLWMNPTEHKALAKIILKELLRKNHGRRFASDIRHAAMMDWLNLSPQSDDQVPQGELWWVKDYEVAEVQVQITLDAGVRLDAEILFESLGLNLETAVTMFLKQSIREQRIPFEITCVHPGGWSKVTNSK